MERSQNCLLTDTTYVQSLIKDSPISDSQSVAKIISQLNLQSHGEGGYFAETDRDSRMVPNPYQNEAPYPNATAQDDRPIRNASTTIYYLLAPSSPVGHFHRNRGRTVHTLHRGRGRYVLIHADKVDENGQAPIETFVVGHDVEKGERLQWIVDGGKFKASYLLPDANTSESDGGLLISETVVPGFEYADHDFMTADGMGKLLTPEQAEEMNWLLNKDERAKWENSTGKSFS